MRAFSKSQAWSVRRQFILFVLATFGFSWGIWLPAVASSQGWITISFLMWQLGSFGPSLAGIILAGICYGRQGLRSLVKRAVHWRVRGRWYGFAIGFPLVITLITIVVDRSIAGESTLLPTLPSPIQVLLIFLIVFALGGPVNEEFGWRGFALPAIQRRFNPLAASLILGSIWALWHVPLFFISGASQNGLPMTWILAQIVALSVIFTWLYNQTGGSVLLAVIFHAALNTMGAVFPLLPEATGSTRAFGITVVVTILTAVIIVVVPSGIRNTTPETDLAT